MKIRKHRNHIKKKAQKNNNNKKTYKSEQIRRTNRQTNKPTE